MIDRKEILGKGINFLKDYFLKKENINKALSCLSDSSFSLDFDNVFINNYIELLSITVGDKEEWIYWYIFENDFGKNKMVAGYYKEQKPVITVDDLYSLIVYITLDNNLLL